MDRWNGRVALVTGASSGIGEALVRALAKEGMKVVAIARNMDKLKALQAELSKESGSVFPIKCDLRNEDDIASMLNIIKDKYGGADVCINSAGLGYYSTLMEGTNDQWRAILEVNVLALSIVTREVIKSMRERGVDDGHIFHISSMSGHRLTCPEEHFYAASKHAVKVLTEGMRRELRQANTHIRITSISPGCVETPFLVSAFSHRPQDLKENEPTYKQIQDTDIASMVLYALGSPAHVELHDILVRPTEQSS